MTISITVICCSLLYTIMVALFYFSKKKLKNIENNIYSFLITISIIGLVIELLCCYFVYNRNISSLYQTLNTIVNKSFIIYLFTWISSFTVYFFFVSFGNRKNFDQKIENNKTKIITSMTIVGLILVGTILFLPLYYVSDGTYIYSYGPATNFLSGIAVVSIIINFLFLFINYRGIDKKKYYPLFVLVVLLILVLIIRNINPGLTIINSVLAFITVLMYFTIENPDVKLIQELNDNRMLVEKTNEEKSNFLFRMSQELKNPVSYIYDISDSLLKEENIDKLKSGINTINISSRKLSYMINNVLDVSSMDSKKIKIVNNKYNIYTILDEIRTRLSKNVKRGVDFRFNVSDNIPTSIYGDAIKLKQVITAIINNSIKYTAKGFIEVNVDSLVKYDVCRLIISIEDSGSGMNLSKVNDLLRLDEELNEDDLKKLGKLDVDLKITKKIIKTLGGSLMVKSEEDKGSSFTVVLDQKIDGVKKGSTSDKYKNVLFKQKRILLVDDEVEEIEKISNLLKENKLDVTISLYGKDAIDKINTGEKFDLILIDDEMPNESGLDTLKEIKKIKNFKTPIIVMLHNDKIRIKKSYLTDGFTDYLDKDNLKSSLNEKIDKYI